MRHWHAQVTHLTLRLLDRPDGFARRDEPDVTAQVELHSDGSAYMHAAMRRREPATPGEWRALVRKLIREHGVTLIEADRGGKKVVIWRSKTPG